MKRITPFLLILAFLLILTGCSSGTEKTEESKEEDKEIVGTWTSDIKYNEETGQQSSTITYIFNEDGTYTLSTETIVRGEDGNEITETSTNEGTYTIDADVLNLKTLKVNGETVDETLQAVDNTITGEPNKDLNTNYSEKEFNISIDGDRMSLKQGDTEYDFVKK